MTHFDDTDLARTAVDRLFAGLAPERIRQAVEVPLDRAAGQFIREPGPCRSQRHLHDVMAAFVQHVFAQGLRLAVRLSSSQARAEALELLGDVGLAYEHALLDALEPHHDGIAFVLARLTDALKARERHKYIQWVLTGTLGLCEWALRCRIAEILRDERCLFLPAELKRCSAAQLADVIPSLILRELDTDCSLDQLASSAASSAFLDS